MKVWRVNPCFLHQCKTRMLFDGPIGMLSATLLNRTDTIMGKSEIKDIISMKIQHISLAHTQQY